MMVRIFSAAATVPAARGGRLQAHRGLFPAPKGDANRKIQFESE